jgi:hypothetical protein
MLSFDYRRDDTGLCAREKGALIATLNLKEARAAV